PNDIPFTKRNSQSVLNTASNVITNEGRYNPEKAPMIWDLSAKELEEQAIFPIMTLEEMRGHDFAENEIVDEVVSRLRKVEEYRELFHSAFPGEKEPVSKLNLSKALASFQRTLINPNTRFVQYMRGASGALSTS